MIVGNEVVGASVRVGETKESDEFMLVGNGVSLSELLVLVGVGDGVEMAHAP